MVRHTEQSWHPNTWRARERAVSYFPPNAVREGALSLSLLPPRASRYMLVVKCSVQHVISSEHVKSLRYRYLLKLAPLLPKHPRSRCELETSRRAVLSHCPPPNRYRPEMRSSPK